MVLLALLTLTGCFEKEEDSYHYPHADSPGDPSVDSTGGAGDTGAADTGPSSPYDDTVCWTLEKSWNASTGYTDLALVTIDMATGALTQQALFTGSDGDTLMSGGLARNGDSFIFSNYNDAGYLWEELNLSTGARTSCSNTTMAESITFDGSAWWTIDTSGGGLQSFASYADLCARTALSTAPGDYYSRLTWDESGTTIIGAWHSTNEVGFYDPATGGQLSTLTLAGWDTWVWGISEAGGKIHLIDDGRQTGSQRLSSFDPSTGAVIEEIDTGASGANGNVYGLWCETR